MLRIVSPISGLERGKFSNTLAGAKNDPGFQVKLPGSDDDHREDIDLSKLVLSNYWAKLTVELNERELKFNVWFTDSQKPKTLIHRVNSTISKGFFADIRFFPKRKGVFKSKGINGRSAWQWVRENCGVAVVDHGFRVKPYGFRNDDWLYLDRDKAHSERDWMTDIAKELFPIPNAIRNRPGDNPALNLPYNYQLVGAIFVESRPASVSKQETDLVPSMDREGFLKNQAFEQLRNCVRAGIEFLAHEDKAELNRIAEIEAREVARSAREDIRKAIKFIQRSQTLTPGDKSRIVKQYKHLADRLDEQEEYSAQARRSLTTMGLLGVVAGFMTHESKAVVHELEQAIEQVKTLSKKHPELKTSANTLSQRLEHFQGYLEYARLFVQNVRAPKELELSASGQIRHILNRFKAFADQKGIVVLNEVAANVKSPPLPVTVYSGVLLNLYTNALKAVLAAHSSLQKPKVVFRAWNEAGKHIVEISDNGIGIPPEMQKRIWEPLYTTTSDIGNPLGSGMGLGLTLVKQVVTDLGGSVILTPKAPPGFTTCFRVVFPIK